MRAFVIKNEEGKYLTETFDWADDLYFAMTYDETYLLSDKREHWQEITIAEGDLQKENEELRNNIVKFIEELAWNDAKYDAFQSTMGDIPASSSSVPRYAKKYFDLWKEMFGENIQQAKEMLNKN